MRRIKISLASNNSVYRTKNISSNQQVLSKGEVEEMTRQPTSSSRRTPILNSVGAWLRLNGAWLLVLALFLVAVAVVYGNDLAILANEALQNEAFSHLLIFPFLLGFLFYLKKDVIKATLLLGRTSKSKTRYVNEISGAALCLVALILYWYGSSTFYPLEYHIASLPIFIMGTVLIVSNARTLIMLIFPILFIFFLVPLPTTLLYTAGGALASVNTQIAYAVLRLTGMPVSLSTFYGAPTLQLATAAGTQMNFSVDVGCPAETAVCRMVAL